MPIQGVGRQTLHHVLNPLSLDEVLRQMHAAAQVLDVRAPGERHDKYIDGSVPLPLNRLQRHLDEVPRDRQVVVQCAGGYRSAIAARILANHGMTQIADLVGGLAAWEEMGLELAAPAMT